MNKTELLKKLKLDLDLFASVKSDAMRLNQPIAQHTGWVFKHIYSKPYHGKTIETNKPARVHHGIVHVGRAAFHARVFANFYRKYNDPEALALTEDDLHLIQIALLLHDSGRVDEGIDDTDEESGLMLYFYLMELGVDKEKATLLAEAVANKDVKDDDYKVLNESDGEFSWAKVKRKTKNIYQRLIHDSDCLDIIRARDKFEAKYLDFMQNIIMQDGKIVNQDAFDELAFFIMEARHLIEIQGDSRFNLLLDVKMKYQHEQAYRQLLEDIKPESHPILTVLGKEGVLHTPKALAQLKLIDKTPYDKTQGITAKNLNAALREGKLFTRSVIKPSRLRDKVKASGIKETNAGIEVRKAARRKGKSTGTMKSNHDAKEGNPFRSTAMGGFTFTNAGFLIIDPDLSQINQISDTDFNSGFAKKSKWRGEVELSNEEKQAQLKLVLHELKSGGVFEPKYQSPHTEILCTLTAFDALFYNHDACLVQKSIQPNATPWHRHAPYFQALYLRHEYAKQFHVNLPIFYYSGYECFVKQEREYTTEEIIKMWEEMLVDHIKSQLAENNFQVLKQTSDQLKVACVYSAKADCNAFLPVDVHYDESTKRIISDIAVRYQKELGDEYEKRVRKELETQSESIFDSKVYLFLIASPAISEEFREIIEKNIAHHLSKRTDLDPPSQLVTSFIPKENIPLQDIYALAKSCRSEKYVAELLQCAQSALDETLERMQSKDTLGFGETPISNIRRLINFANGFDLSTNYQAKIIKEAKALLKVNHWFYQNPHGKWWEWMPYLFNFLFKNNQHAILAALKEDAQALLVNHQSLFRGDFQPAGLERAASELKDVLEAYLVLSKLCEISTEERKSVLISFFKKFNAVGESTNCQFNFENEFDMIHDLKESGLLSDNDVFQHVLYHLCDMKYDYKDLELVYSSEFYINNLVFLIRAIPATELCDTKMDMINKDFAKRVKQTHLQLLLDLLNKQTMHPVIILTGELQSIIVSECETRLNQLSISKAEEFTASRCKETASFFALIDHLEQYEIQHPGFENILKLKKTVESQLKSIALNIGKYEIVQPMFAGKACKIKATILEHNDAKPQNTSNFTLGFWARTDSGLCGAIPKSPTQAILERFICK